jgi:hypothetical protein
MPLGGEISHEKRALAREYFIEDVHTGITHNTKLPDHTVTHYAEILEFSEDILRKMENLISESEMKEVECMFT